MLLSRRMKSVLENLFFSFIMVVAIFGLVFIVNEVVDAIIDYSGGPAGTGICIQCINNVLSPFGLEVVPK